MQREKDDLHDNHYRRDFLTYDNHILDGEVFLQVINSINKRRNTQPTLSYFKSFKIRHTTFLYNIKFVNRLIVSL